MGEMVLRASAAGRAPVACRLRSVRRMAVHLFDLANGREIGILTDEQFEFLADHLEAEDTDDDDYYLNQATLDAFEQEGADAHVLGVLKAAMAGRSEMDIRWQREEQDVAAASEPGTE
jgi:hypothetical protein